MRARIYGCTGVVKNNIFVRKKKLKKKKRWLVSTAKYFNIYMYTSYKYTTLYDIIIIIIIITTTIYYYYNCIYRGDNIMRVALTPRRLRHRSRFSPECQTQWQHLYYCVIFSGRSVADVQRDPYAYTWNSFYNSNK